MNEIGAMSDSKRVPTRAWSFTASGGMSRNDGDEVEIEEAAPVSAPASVAPAPAPSAHAQPSSRPRRSTLETFNDEMAVLERPLEGEIEYFDEKPPSRWPRLAGFVAVVVVVGVGGSLAISRHRAAAGMQALAAQPASEASPAPAAAQPMLAARTAAPPVAPAAPEAAPAEGAVVSAAGEAPSDDATAASDDDSARPASGSRSAWGKVRNKAGDAKHARSSSSKTTHHRSTTKRSAAGKRSSRHH
jgi:hypothetical protein